MFKISYESFASAQSPWSLFMLPSAETTTSFNCCTPATLTYPAHSAPMQMVFYTANQFPAEYRNDAFIAFHGSWNRENPKGYEVVQLHFDENGKPKEFKPFLSGFLVDGGAKAIGRPVGLAVAKDGSLLVSDDTCGVIYRVSYSR